MVGRQMMGRIDSRLCQARPGGEHTERPGLGCVSWACSCNICRVEVPYIAVASFIRLLYLFVGDPGQCEAIRDQQLYDVAPHRKPGTDQDLAAVRLSSAGLEVYRWRSTAPSTTW